MSKAIAIAATGTAAVINMTVNGGVRAGRGLIE